MTKTEKKKLARIEALRVAACHLQIALEDLDWELKTPMDKEMHAYYEEEMEKLIESMKNRAIRAGGEFELHQPEVVILGL